MHVAGAARGERRAIEGGEHAEARVGEGEGRRRAGTLTGAGAC